MSDPDCRTRGDLRRQPQVVHGVAGRNKGPRVERQLIMTTLHPVYYCASR